MESVSRRAFGHGRVYKLFESKSNNKQERKLKPAYLPLVEGPWRYCKISSLFERLNVHVLFGGEASLVVIGCFISVFSQPPTLHQIVLPPPITVSKFHFQ